MFVTDSFKDLAKATRQVCLAIGVFDGIHRGHQQVIGQAVEDAKKCGGDSVVLTFDPHPARVLRPDKAPPLLTSTPHKLRLIEALGAKACLVLKFDRALAHMPPQEFLDWIVRDINELQEICVGHQWCFGQDRGGTVAFIERYGKQHGFTVKEVPILTVDGEKISSTLIRRAVAHGDLARAETMLGRQFSILGTVVKGDGRGHELGFPTANLDPHNEVLPPDGVYAVRARLFSEAGDDLMDGVVNIGLRPTIQSSSHLRTVEAHLFGLSQDLYGCEIELIFHQKIRDEQEFESLDALKHQIAADCAAAKAVLSSTIK